VVAQHCASPSSRITIRHLFFPSIRPSSFQHDCRSIITNLSSSTIVFSIWLIADIMSTSNRVWSNFGGGDVTNMLERDSPTMRGYSKSKHSAEMSRQVNKKQRTELKDEAITITCSKVGFFDLPAEMRNQIYDLALVSKYRIDFDRRNPNATNPHEILPLGLTPNLLQTSKAVYQEAILILLRRNTFVNNLWGSDCIADFLNPAPIASSKFIRHIVLKSVNHFPCVEGVSKKVLDMIEKLQSLTIEFTYMPSTAIVDLLASNDAASKGVQMQLRHVTRVTGDLSPKFSGFSRPDRPGDITAEKMKSSPKVCKCWISYVLLKEDHLKSSMYLSRRLV
jgi:hypothetical protein